MKAVTSKSLLVCLAVLVVAIIYKLWATDSDNGILLSLVGLIIGGLALAGLYNRREHTGNIALTSILIAISIVVLFFWQPAECQFNESLYADMADSIDAGKDKYLTEQEKVFESIDPAAADSTLHALFSRLIPDELRSKELKKSCYRVYEKKLQTWSEKEITSYVQKKKFQLELCHDINRIIDQKNRSLIELLYNNYNIDSNATVIEVYEKEHARMELGKLKHMLDDAILTREPISMKSILDYKSDPATQKITEISFVNQQTESL